MQSNSFLNNKYLPLLIAATLLLGYLWPIFQPHIYVETFDNLDSTVVWMKLLAQSGKIFAASSDIIPNMMNGIPRIAYGNEFSVLFWLYYFFEPETAFRINIVLIHTVAFVSMYVFLYRYVSVSTHLRHWLAAFVSLLYAILPFWPGAGLSSSLLPLYTYIFLNIYHGKERRFEWLLLCLMPFYSSFIFMYLFYMGFAWFGWIYLAIKNRNLQKRLFFALLLVSTIFLFREYRLLLAQIFGSGFISHRSEFNVYLNLPFLQAYTYAVKFFLDGWMEHQRTLMMPMLLPFILSALLIAPVRRKLTQYESMLFLAVIALLYWSDLWHTIIVNRYMIPLLSIYTLWLTVYRRKYRLFALLVFFLLLLSIWDGLCFYDGLSFLKEQFPIFKMFNFSRAAFIAPFVWYIVVLLAFDLFLQKVRYSSVFIVFLIAYQIYYSMHVKHFYAHPAPKMITFEAYYAPKLFEKVKKSIPGKLTEHRFVSYGIEPAVSLYNGFYTVDGYSTNYPLDYKHAFAKTQEECFKKMPGNKKMFDTWGSKLYLLCIESRPWNYHLYEDRNITQLPFNADTKALCNLGADYLLSGHKIKNPKRYDLEFINTFEEKSAWWTIWLYRLRCAAKR